MKKYFMAGTNDEGQLGDVISVNMEKEFKGGRTLTREMEFKITEETIPFALDMGIIEEKGEEEEADTNDLLDFEDIDIEDVVSDHEQMIEALVESDEEFLKRLDVLEKRVKTLEGLVKTASPKKK